jgi:hypothetical protein
MSITTAILLLLTACDRDRGETYTLYRNSPLDPSLRVHFATFNSNNHGDYNSGNCMMAARLLNANSAASAKAEGKPQDKEIGFWCEPGDYSEKGSVPSQFDSAFPAHSDGLLSW